MKVKLDENVGLRGVQLLKDCGCDVATVATVASEDLCASSDEKLVEVCRVERRTLITLDKDFASILRFPPQRYAGIVVLRLPDPLTRDTIDDALRRVFRAASGTSLTGRLWVVDERRIREFAGRESDALRDADTGRE